MCFTTTPELFAACRLALARAHAARPGDRPTNGSTKAQGPAGIVLLRRTSLLCKRVNNSAVYPSGVSPVAASAGMVQVQI